MKISNTLRKAISGSEIALIEMVYKIEMDSAVLEPDDVIFICADKSSNKYLIYLKACIYFYGVPQVEKNHEKSKDDLIQLIDKKFFYAEALLSLHDNISDSEKDRLHVNALQAYNSFALINNFHICYSKLDIQSDIKGQLDNLMKDLGPLKIAYRVLMQTSFKYPLDSFLAIVQNSLSAIPDTIIEMRSKYLDRQKRIEADQWQRFTAVDSSVNLSLMQSEEKQNQVHNALIKTWLKVADFYKETNPSLMFNALHKAYNFDGENKPEILDRLLIEMYKRVPNSLNWFKKMQPFENFGEIQKYFSIVNKELMAVKKRFGQMEGISLKDIDLLQGQLVQVTILFSNLEILFESHCIYFKNGEQAQKLQEMLNCFKADATLLQSKLTAKRSELTNETSEVFTSQISQLTALLSIAVNTNTQLISIMNLLIQDRERQKQLETSSESTAADNITVGDDDISDSEAKVSTKQTDFKP